MLAGAAVGPIQAFRQDVKERLRRDCRRGRLLGIGPGADARRTAGRSCWRCFSGGPPSSRPGSCLCSTRCSGTLRGARAARQCPGRRAAGARGPGLDPPYPLSASPTPGGVRHRRRPTGVNDGHVSRRPRRRALWGEVLLEPEHHGQTSHVKGRSGRACDLLERDRASKHDDPPLSTHQDSERGGIEHLDAPEVDHEMHSSRPDRTLQTCPQLRNRIDVQVAADDNPPDAAVEVHDAPHRSSVYPPTTGRSRRHAHR